MSEKVFLCRGSVPAVKRKTVTVEVPELECSVILRELSYGQLKQIDDDVAKQLSLMIVDESGERVFSTDEEIAQINEFSAATVTLLIQSAAQLNGISKAAVDEAVKN